MAKINKVVKELIDLGINDTFSKKIYKAYGEASMDLIRENPYRLMEDFSGVPFHEVDSLAAKLSLEPEDKRRIVSGIYYGINKLTENGSACVPASLLLENVGPSILDLSMEDVENALQGMSRDGLIVVEEVDGVDMVYNTQIYESEVSVAERLIQMNQNPGKLIARDLEGLLSFIQRDTGVILSETQKTTIQAVMAHRVSVITGGPGTGKTTIINGVIHLLKAAGEKTAICAPTGRAAKRIKEATGNSATTIHRLLEAELDEERHSVYFRRCENNPLELDAVIVDESSMLDIFLMEALLDALPPSTRLVLVGDVDQLPPVGPGRVLKDIIESGIIPTFFLKEIFRQSKESLIVNNAHRINKGEYPQNGDGTTDFFIHPTKTDILQSILDWMMGKSVDGIDFPVKPGDIQVITMTKNGPYGTLALNTKLQNEINPPTVGKTQIQDWQGRIFRVGDKVMQTKNNYQLEWKSTQDFSDGLGVFNGEIGEIESIDLDCKQIGVLYDESRYVIYQPDQWLNLDLAYAITVHKSQGSEFPGIIMPLVWTTPKLAHRNLLYTAITRGRDKVVLVGSERMLNSMVDNYLGDQRQTGLAYRLLSGGQK